jgi:hypothetical protein
MIKALGDHLIDTVAKNCVAKGTQADEAESRKHGVRALIKIIKTRGVVGIGKEKVKDVLEVFYRCLNDYAVDRRGDVGSWVREEGMWALKDLIQLIVESKDYEIIQLVEADKP